MLAVTRATSIPLSKLPRSSKPVYYFSTYKWTCEEVRVPVPWGHIAGKWWGPQDRRPVLGLHGWQDNCGTFDTLIPHLNPHVGFLVIDLPGHGLSSHIPPGGFYHWPDYIIVVKRIVDYFKWSKVSLMGHSLGGIVSYLYSTLYPDSVDFLICLDALKPLRFNKKIIPHIGQNIDSIIKYDSLRNSNTEPYSCTMEELEAKLHEGSGDSIALEACKIMLRRGVAPSIKEPGKYYYTRDARLKLLSLLDYGNEELIVNAHRLTCPTILCLTNYRSGLYKVLKNAEDVYNIIQKSNKNFEMHKIEGTHHVHLNNPERVQRFINNFVSRYNVEDRSIGGLKEEIRICSNNM